MNPSSPKKKVTSVSEERESLLTTRLPGGGRWTFKNSVVLSRSDADRLCCTCSGERASRRSCGERTRLNNREKLHSYRRSRRWWGVGLGGGKDQDGSGKAPAGDQRMMYAALTGLATAVWCHHE